MVTLLQIYRRLSEMFGCSKGWPFAGKSVPVVGDLLQLPLVKSQLVYNPCTNAFGSLFYSVGTTLNAWIHRSYEAAREFSI